MSLSPGEALALAALIVAGLYFSTRHKLPCATRRRGAWHHRAAHPTQWANDKRGETQTP